MIDLIEFEKTVKLKTDRAFIQALYNNNFILKTEKFRMINSAYKFKDELKLKIKRMDYSSIYIISME